MAIDITPVDVFEVAEEMGIELDMEQAFSFKESLNMDSIEKAAVLGQPEGIDGERSYARKEIRAQIMIQHPDLKVIRHKAIDRASRRFFDVDRIIHRGEAKNQHDIYMGAFNRAINPNMPLPFFFMNTQRIESTTEGCLAFLNTVHELESDMLWARTIIVEEE